MIREFLFGPKTPKVSHIQFGDGDGEDEIRTSYRNWSGAEDVSPLDYEEFHEGLHRKKRFKRKFRLSSMDKSLTGRKSDDSFDVTKIAIFSRLVVLLLQVFARILFPKHVNDGFRTPRFEGNALDNIVTATFEGFVNWDGEYFLHIATNGYTHVNTIAFFPLFPALVGYSSALLQFFPLRFLTLHSIAFILGWGLNTWCFVQAAIALKSLVKHLDRGMGNLVPSVIYLFCFNPASIFFSAFYSESLFAYLTFNVLLALYKRNLTRAVAFAALGAACRSNGLLNFGFIGIFVLRDSLGKKGLKERRLSDIIYDVTQGFLMCCIGLFPFLYYQLYCLWKFCDPSASGIKESEALPFCGLKVLPYSYIQSANWNVGFMSYFELRQLPNFLLAAPVLAVMTHEAFKRARFYANSVVKSKKLYHLPDLTLACHGLLLVSTCFFFVHVQVSTRMIFSACPYLYIYIAKSIRSETYRFRAHQLEWLPYTFSIHTWCAVYFVLGTLAFSLGLPWT